jgi:hypothetical protein
MSHPISEKKKHDPFFLEKAFVARFIANTTLA